MLPTEVGRKHSLFFYESPNKILIQVQMSLSLLEPVYTRRLLFNKPFQPSGASQDPRFRSICRGNIQTEGLFAKKIFVPPPPPKKKIPKNPKNPRICLRIFWGVNNPSRQTRMHPIRKSSKCSTSKKTLNVFCKFNVENQQIVAVLLTRVKYFGYFTNIDL